MDKRMATERRHGFALLRGRRVLAFALVFVMLFSLTFADSAVFAMGGVSASLNAADDENAEDGGSPIPEPDDMVNNGTRGGIQDFEDESPVGTENAAGVGSLPADTQEPLSPLEPEAVVSPLADADSFVITPSWVGENQKDTTITVGSGNEKTVNIIITAAGNWGDIDAGKATSRKLVIEYKKHSDGYDDGKTGFRLTDYTGRSDGVNTFELARLKGVANQKDIILSGSGKGVQVPLSPNNASYPGAAWSPGTPYGGDGRGDGGRLIYHFNPEAHFDVATVQLSFRAESGSGNIGNSAQPFPGVIGNDYSAYDGEQLDITAYFVDDVDTVTDAASIPQTSYMAQPATASAKASCPQRYFRASLRARSPLAVGAGASTGQLYIGLYGTVYIKLEEATFDFAKAELRLGNIWVSYLQLLKWEAGDGGNYPQNLGTGANQVTITSNPFVLTQKDGAALEIGPDGYPTLLKVSGQHESMHTSYGVEEQNQWTLSYTTTAEFAKINNQAPRFSIGTKNGAWAANPTTPPLGIDISVKWKYSLSGRGPEQTAEQREDTDKTNASPANKGVVYVHRSENGTGAKNDCGQFYASDVLSLSLSAPFYGPAGGNRQKSLQPNSELYKNAYKTYQGSNKDQAATNAYFEGKGYLYYQHLAVLQLGSSRMSQAGAKDEISFHIPPGVTLTHITLPHNCGVVGGSGGTYKNSAYSGASFPFDVKAVANGETPGTVTVIPGYGSSALGSPNLSPTTPTVKPRAASPNLVELVSPISGAAGTGTDISFTLYEVEYIGRNAGDNVSLLSGARLGFIGTTDGTVATQSVSGNVRFSATARDGATGAVNANAPTTDVYLLEDGKIMPGRAVTTGSVIYTNAPATPTGPTPVAGSVAKGQEIYMTGFLATTGAGNRTEYFGGSWNNQPYNMPNYVDPLPRQDGAAVAQYAPTPVVYFSVPPGIEIGAQVGDHIKVGETGSGALSFTKQNARMTGKDAYGKELMATVTAITDAGYGIFTDGKNGTLPGGPQGKLVEISITDADGKATMFTNAANAWGSGATSYPAGYAYDDGYYLYLKLKVPVDFDELLNGNSFAFRPESQLTSYTQDYVSRPLHGHGNLASAPYNPATGRAGHDWTTSYDGREIQKFSFPKEAKAFSAAATENHTKLPDANSPEWWFQTRGMNGPTVNKLLLSLPPTASSSASAQEGADGTSYTYYPGMDVSKIPATYAGDGKMLFRYSMFYNVDGIPAAPDSVGYFVLPTGGRDWRPVLEGQPYITHTAAWKAFDVYYTSSPMAGATLNEATGVLDGVSPVWKKATTTEVSTGKMSVDIPEAELKTVTALRLVYHTVPLGCQLNLYMPYTVDKVEHSKVGESTVAGDGGYGDPITGNIYYWFGSANNQVKNTQIGSVVKLVRSSLPMILEPDGAGGTQELSGSKPAEPIVVSQGSPVSGVGSSIPAWAQDIIVYDDHSQDMSLAKLKVTFAPQDGSSGSVTEFTIFDTQPYTEQPAKNKEGTVSSIRFPEGKQAADYVNTEKPGIYTLEYTSTEDGDSQTKSLIRKLVVKRALYEVHYDADGGTLSSGTESPLTGVSWSAVNLLPVTNPAKSGGWDFDAWEAVSLTLQDGTVQALQTPVAVTITTSYGALAQLAELPIGTEPKDVVTKITLKAKWKPHIWKVRFFDNRGAGNKQLGSAIEVANGKKLSELGTAGEIPGLTKDSTPGAWDEHRDLTDKWLLSNTGTAKTADEVKEAPVTRDTDWYAEWTPADYVLAFDPRGGSFAGGETLSGGFALRSVSFVEEDLNAVPQVDAHIQNLSEAGLALPVLSPRTGYDFLGWSLDPDDDEDSIGITGGFDESDEPEGSATVYAVWGAHTHDVRYEYKTGSGRIPLLAEALPNAAHGVRYGTQLALPALPGAVTGYEMSSWLPSPAALDVSAGSYEMPDEEVVFTLTWTPKRYAVRFLPNAGTASVTGQLPDGSARYDMDYTLPENTFLRTGYSFLGWNTESDGSGTSYTDAESLGLWQSDEPLSLYAMWRVNRYTLRYDGNGHSAGAAPAAQSADYLAALTAAQPGQMSRAGYSFLGWNTDAAQAHAGSVSHIQGAGLLLTGDTTLYAVWKQDAVAAPSGGAGTNPPPAVPAKPKPVPVPIAPAEEAPEVPMPQQQNEPSETPAQPGGEERLDEPKEPTSDGVPPKYAALFRAQTGNVFKDIVSGNVPIGSFSFGGAWSLLSAIFSLAGILIALFYLLGALTKWRREAQEDAYGEKKRSRKGVLLCVLAIAAGLLTCIVWYILENIAQPMAWLNTYTWIVAIIFAACVVCAVLCKKNYLQNPPDDI